MFCFRSGHPIMQRKFLQNIRRLMEVDSSEDFRLFAARFAWGGRWKSRKNMGSYGLLGKEVSFQKLMRKIHFEKWGKVGRKLSSFKAEAHFELLFLVCVSDCYVAISTSLSARLGSLWPFPLPGIGKNLKEYYVGVPKNNQLREGYSNK